MWSQYLLKMWEKPSCRKCFILGVYSVHWNFNSIALQEKGGFYKSKTNCFLKGNKTGICFPFYSQALNT